MNVTHILQKWYGIHKRDLPWRVANSPYHIWLSEIILQQTRVIQGLAYYIKFTTRFPVIEDLAASSLDEILKLWQGLGYYTRARNMHLTAKLLVSEHNGIFPDSFNGLIKLKGIGYYTAAAIASICFREPVAVVDGNVSRVISRFFGMPFSADAAGKKECNRMATMILDRENPHIHNQAMMELGALVCLPKNPKCTECPISPGCLALKSGKTNVLPLKQFKKPPVNRYFNYIFIMSQGHTWLNKRIKKDIWHSLYEFPLIETFKPMTFQELSCTPAWQEIMGGMKAEPVGKVWQYRHKLTHQTIHGSFYHFITPGNPVFSGKPPFKIKCADLGLFAFPVLIGKFLADLKPDSP